MLGLLLSCLAMMLLQHGLLVVERSVDPAVGVEMGEPCAAVPKDSKRPSHKVFAGESAEGSTRCNARLGPVVLVVDASKSTAYAALKHVTLCTRPHVRRTCPE